MAYTTSMPRSWGGRGLAPTSAINVVTMPSH